LSGAQHHPLFFNTPVLANITKTIAAATVISLTLVACAHTEFPAVTVKSSPVGTARLPLTIAVLDDRSITVHPLFDFYEKMNPAMANAVHDALAANFEKVVVIDDSKLAADADLLAVSEVALGRKRTLMLTVTFVQPKTGTTITELSSTQPFKSDEPGAHTHQWSDLAAGMAASAIPFGAGIVLLEPYLQRHDAQRFNAGFSPAPAAMATDIATQASKDPAIVALPLSKKVGP
jgi:hypothetical protein